MNIHAAIVFLLILWVGGCVSGPDVEKESAAKTNRAQEKTAVETQKTRSKLDVVREQASQGEASAQLELGTMYETGSGVRKDFAKAMKWYAKAAEQGVADAQIKLAAMYREGRGVPQDFLEAEKWYRRAAEQGDTAAQITLGVMYFEGKEIPRDKVQAHMWLNIAASRLSPGTQRDTVVENRKIVASWMTLTQIAEAQKMAREWKPKFYWKKKVEPVTQSAQERRKNRFAK